MHEHLTPSTADVLGLATLAVCVLISVDAMRLACRVASWRTRFLLLAYMLVFILSAAVNHVEGGASVLPIWVSDLARYAMPVAGVLFLFGGGWGAVVEQVIRRRMVNGLQLCDTCPLGRGVAQQEKRK